MYFYENTKSLQEAINDPDPRKFLEMIRFGLDPNHIVNHNSLLTTVILNKFEFRAEFLLKFKASVNPWTGKKGTSPLNAAAKTGNLSILKMLVARGAHKNSTVEAAIHGHVDCLRFLLDAKAMVDPENKGNGTPLAFAVINNSFRCTDLLLQRKADPNITFEDGTTILMKVCKRGYFNTQNSLLLKYGALVNTCNRVGRSALFYACKHNNTRWITLLLQHGANPSLSFPCSFLNDELYEIYEKPLHLCLPSVLVSEIIKYIY